MISICPLAVATASLLSSQPATDPSAVSGLATYERVILAAPAPVAPGTSLLSYTFLEVGYYSTDVDSFDESTDAVYGRASLDLFDLFYVFFEYADESLDNVDGTAGGGSSALVGIPSTIGDITNEQFTLGVGVHLPLADRIDVLGEAAWLYSDLQSDQFANLDDTNDGWTAFAGLRWLALPWPTGGLELNGGARWTDIPALLSDEEVLSWEVGTRAHFLEFLSVGVRYQIQEDDQTYALNARLSL